MTATAKKTTFPASQLEAKILPFPRQAANKSEILKKRAHALIIDLFIIGALKKLALLSFGLFLKSFFYQTALFTQVKIINFMPTLNLACTFPLVFFYFLASYGLGESRTLGQIFCKLDIYSQAKTSNFKQAFMRSCGHLLGYSTAGILFALPAFRQDQKSLADLFSQTEMGIYQQPVTESAPEYKQDYLQAA